MADARFEDGTPEQSLRLKAETADDLSVISALVQDAVTQTSDMSWMRKKHQFAVLLNRFRWEDKTAAERSQRPFERVQSLLVVRNTLGTRAQDIDPNDKDLVLELLGISFEPADDGAGQVLLTFAGDGVLAMDVECLDVQLQDVSRPYVARSQSVPSHPETD